MTVHVQASALSDYQFPANFPALFLIAISEMYMHPVDHVQPTSPVQLFKSAKLTNY